MRLLFSFISLLVMVGTAHAHIGHLGDLAGHSHWVGVGAVIVAGVLGGVLGKKVLDEKSNEIEADAEEEAETETEGSAA